MALQFSKFVIQLLNEKYYTYTPPKDKEKLMYDFYVINYLMFLLGQPSKTHRDLKEDVVDNVRDTAKTLYTELKDQMLYAVFYAICAEFRHTESKSANRTKIPEKYKKGLSYHKGSSYELIEIGKIVSKKLELRPKPTLIVRIPGNLGDSSHSSSVEDMTIEE